MFSRCDRSSQLNRTAVKQQFFCKRRLPRVRVRDYRECPSLLYFFLNIHKAANGITLTGEDKQRDEAEKSRCNHFDHWLANKIQETNRQELLKIYREDTAQTPQNPPSLRRLRDVNDNSKRATEASYPPPSQAQSLNRMHNYCTAVSTKPTSSACSSKTRTSACNIANTILFSFADVAKYYKLLLYTLLIRSKLRIHSTEWKANLCQPLAYQALDNKMAHKLPQESEPEIEFYKLGA